MSELVVHVGAGFAAKERPRIREAMASLRPHLGRFDDVDVSVEVSVQDRGRREQRVTLRTVLPGRAPLLTVVANADLMRALVEAKNELVRQHDHHNAARQAMHNRRLSSRTIRQLVAGPPAVRRILWGGDG